MQLRNVFAITLAAAVASSAWAQTQESAKAAKAKSEGCTKSAKLVEGKAGCGSKAQLASDKAGCGSKAKLASDKATCGSKAQLVSGKAGCGSKAKLASDKATCSTKAQLASDKATCSSKAKLASAKGVCGNGKAVARAIPAMRYQVGDNTTSCPEEAKKLAETGGAEVQYVVGEKTIAKEGEAKQAYAAMLASHLKEMTQVKFAVGDDCVPCPMTAKSMAKKSGKKMQYRLASYNFETEDAAKKAADAARKAADKVTMKMIVGEKEFCCATTAASVAKTDGKKVEYCVGEKRTPCNTTASVELALAKLNAAYDALEAESAS